MCVDASMIVTLKWGDKTRAAIRPESPAPMTQTFIFNPNEKHLPVVGLRYLIVSLVKESRFTLITAIKANVRKHIGRNISEGSS